MEKETIKNQELVIITEQLRAIARELRDLNANLRLIVYVLKQLPLALHIPEEADRLRS